MVNLYCLFHLNTSFSSIRKEDLSTVIEKCYWPLLNIIEKHNVKLNIEATGSTLLDINKTDRSWIKKLNYLLKEKKCEFIGSGFKQIIAPLVPFEVNRFNLQKGNQIYRNLINLQPNIAFINEQAYSKSLIQNYKKNNYKAIMIDWNNSFVANPSWKNSMQYFPQKVYDDYGNSIKVIWNNSINFQKFQRYIYGEKSENDFLKNLRKLKSSKNYFFSLYGSDAEVFNFRPKRFFNEQNNNLNEWTKIKNLIEILKSKKNFKFIKISEILNFKNFKNFKNNLISNSKSPIIVKKQSKYNPTRWALSGRGDLELNTFCWRYFDKIKSNKNVKNWEKICDFWSSDFRTHITKKKWKLLNDKIKSLRLKKKLKNKINKKFKPKYI